MDDKKEIKNFINYICSWIEHDLRVKCSNSFLLNLTNDRMSYLIADKGIEKRLEKMLFKKFNLESKVFYELKSSPNLYPSGELSVKLLI